jgi:DNA-binding FadR family transcriptional regulator
MAAPGPADDVRRRRLRLHGSIAHDLGVSIVSGRLAQGQSLDGEIAASDNLKVSRSAYREAIRILVAKGLIETRPKTGARVSPRSNWRLLDPDVLAWIFEQEPPADLIFALFELRQIVEPRMASLAAERRTEAQLARMRAAIDDMEALKLTSEQGRAADEAFHTALIEASDNPFLVSLSSGINAVIAWSTAYKSRRNRLQRDAIPDHRAVYEAVALSHPLEAYAAMKTLIDLALRDTLADGG